MECQDATSQSHLQVPLLVILWLHNCKEQKDPFIERQQSVFEAYITANNFGGLEV